MTGTDPRVTTQADQRRAHFYPRLAAFFALTFAWSWACWLLSVLVAPYSAALAVVPGLLAGFGPGLAAVAVVSYVSGRAGLRAWLERCLQWRVGWGWLALAFFLPLGTIAIAAAVHVALGGLLPPSPASGHIAKAAAGFLWVLLLGGPVGEEFGWRGYALPEMTDRYGWRVASLALGGLWAAWHLPLFFMAGTSQHQTPLVGFIVMTLAISVIFAWLFNHTRRSVVPALVLHTAINTWSFIAPVLPSEETQRPYFLAVGLMVLIGLAALQHPGASDPSIHRGKPA
jgi:uncharacterized protein